MIEDAEIFVDTDRQGLALEVVVDQGQGHPDLGQNPPDLGQVQSPGIGGEVLGMKKVCYAAILLQLVMWKI